VPGGAESHTGRKSHLRTRANRTLSGTIAPYVLDADLRIVYGRAEPLRKTGF